MKDLFNFEAELFEFESEFDEYEEEQPDVYSEFDSELEGVDTELSDLEWEEEVRGRQRIPIRPTAPRLRPIRRRLSRRPPGRPIIRPRPRPGVILREPLIVEPGPQGTEYVRWVQSSLNQIMQLQLPVNGIMGPETRSAIRSFQERQRLPADGIVGPDTERAIIAARAGQTTETRDKQPTEPSDSQPSGPEDSQQPESGEFEAFDTDSEFDEYEAEQLDTYSEFDEEYESDFEGEPFEIYPEFDGAELVYENSETVAIPGGNLCGVVHRDVKKVYGSLADLWQKLRDRRSTDEIKRARAALYKDVKRIVRRVRGGRRGWYAKKGCKKFDFNWIDSKAVNMTSDKELRQDKYVRKMSKWLSDYAKKAL